jgi:hypothetical protein
MQIYLYLYFLYYFLNIGEKKMKDLVVKLKSAIAEIEQTGSYKKLEENEIDKIVEITLSAELNQKINKSEIEFLNAKL